jgi:hypothetical protein
LLKTSAKDKILKVTRQKDMLYAEEQRKRVTTDLFSKVNISKKRTGHIFKILEFSSHYMYLSKIKPGAGGSRL